MTNVTINVSGPGADLAASFAKNADASAGDVKTATARADIAADLSVATPLTLPNVYATSAAGLAAVAENATFWAQLGSGSPRLYRKVNGLAEMIGLPASGAGVALSAYGAVADAKIVQFASIALGSALLTANAAIFSAADIGKPIRVAQAGPNSTNLDTTIADFISTTQVSLAATAQTAVANVGASFGTPAGPALQLALDDIKARRGGTLLIDGFYFLNTGVEGSFQSLADNVRITTGGEVGAILIACPAAVKAIQLTSVSQLLIDNLQFVGTPLAQLDSFRVLDLSSVEAEIKDVKFIGLGAIGPEGAAVLYHTSSLIRLSGNKCYGCSAASGQATSIFDGENWIGYTSQGNEFIDHGNFQGIDYTGKLGLAFPLAWERLRQQFTDTANAKGQGTALFSNNRYDEGHYRAIIVSTSPGTGRRIDRVLIENCQINHTLLDGGSSIVIERATNVRVERTNIGWCNVERQAMTFNECGVVEVAVIKATAGAPGPSDKWADGIIANNVESLTVTDSPSLRRRLLTNVRNVREIDNGRGGVVPITKAGRITDADFKTPPAVGTIGVDIVNKRIYARMPEGWLATAAMSANDDPTFVLSNVTPANGQVTNSVRYAKIAGGTGWGTTTANLMQAMVGSFRMRVSFPSAAAANFVRVGMVPASFGATAVTGLNDIRLGVLQNAGTQIYIIHNSDLLNGPFPYAAGQEVQLEYNAQAGTYRLLIGGVEKLVATAAPSDVGTVADHRLTSTLYNVGAAFDLLEYGPT